MCFVAFMGPTSIKESSFGLCLSVLVEIFWAFIS